ncbi:MAG: hypothetical protein ACYTGO_18315, partial [Planctomycetota bacterium]
MASPVLSVITFAREDPLAVRHALESLADQVEEHPVEVIVADGSGEPEAVTREFPWVRHLSL